MPLAADEQARSPRAVRARARTVVSLSHADELRIKRMPLFTAPEAR